MIKKRQVVFEVVEDTETKERSMNGQLNIEDMKIIIEMIYQFVKQHPCLFDEDPYLFDEGGYDV